MFFFLKFELAIQIKNVYLNHRKFIETFLGPSILRDMNDLFAIFFFLKEVDFFS